MPDAVKCMACAYEAVIADLARQSYSGGLLRKLEAAAKQHEHTPSEIFDKREAERPRVATWEMYVTHA